MKIQLTTRERDVLRLAALGYSDPDIAKMLKVSPHAAAIYVSKLRDKLGRFDRGLLPGLGLLLGVVTVEEVREAALAFLQSSGADALVLAFAERASQFPGGPPAYAKAFNDLTPEQISESSKKGE